MTNKVITAREWAKGAPVLTTHLLEKKKTLNRDIEKCKEDIEKDEKARAKKSKARASRGLAGTRETLGNGAIICIDPDKSDTESDSSDMADFGSVLSELSSKSCQETGDSDEDEQDVTYYAIHDQIGVFTKEDAGDESDSVLSNIIIRPRQETPQGRRDRRRVSEVEKLLKLQDGYIDENSTLSKRSHRPTSASSKSDRRDDKRGGKKPEVKAHSRAQLSSKSLFPNPRVTADFYGTPNPTNRACGDWTEEEQRATIYQMKRLEPHWKANRERLWFGISAEVRRTKGLNRSGNAVKNFWNRVGRERSGYDERTRGDRSAMRTSELPGRRSVVDNAKVSAEDSDDKTKYCICDSVSYGNMVMCDNDDCDCGRQWFHYHCVGLKKAPTGDWLCPECRQKT